MAQHRLLPAFAIFLSACDSKVAPPALSHPVRWSAEALELKQLSGIDRELAQPLDEPILVSRGNEKRSVTGCSSGLDLVAQHFEPVSTPDQQALRAVVLHCLALKALKDALPANRSYLDGFRFDDGTLARIPAILALAISKDQIKRRDEAEARQRSWAQLDPSASVRAGSEDSCLVEGDGWEQRLQIIARGDFDRDGIEDWLIQDEAWMTKGSYRSVRLFLLTRTGAGRMLRVIRELGA